MKIHKNVFKFSLRKSAKFPVGEIQIIFRSKMRQFKNLKKREEKIKEKINKQNRKKTEKNSRKKKYFWRENSIQTKQKKKTEKKQKNTTEKTKLQKTRKKIYFWRENSNSFLVIYYQYFYPNQLL